MQNTKINPVSWFEIYVDDLDRATKFYTEVLGIEITPMPTPGNMPIQMMAFPSDMVAPGASGALVKMEGYGPSGLGTIIYFESEDCANEESRITGAGGQVIRPKTGIDEYGFMVIATDSEGNTFGVHSMK